MSSLGYFANAAAGMSGAEIWVSKKTGEEKTRDQLCGRFSYSDHPPSSIWSEKDEAEAQRAYRAASKSANTKPQGGSKRRKSRKQNTKRKKQAIMKKGRGTRKCRPSRRRYR